MRKVQLVRLQKYLSECGVASRRASEELIIEGAVSVNGQIVTELGTKIDPQKDMVRVKKKIIRPEEKGVILFHKPRRVVCTMSDPEGRPTVADYLTSKYRSYRPVGRLDWDTMGLLILTNDGDLAEMLAHPRNQFDRVYEARVAGRIDERTYEKLNRGFYVEGDRVVPEVEEIEFQQDSTWVRITVREGKNHLVKIIFDKVRHPVQKLKRISHGPFKLGGLQPGEMRKLTEGEYIRYKRKIQSFKPRQVVSETSGRPSGRPKRHSPKKYSQRPRGDE
jgi:23S rRNA pseudouridine2605 synthase